MRNIEKYEKGDRRVVVRYDSGFKEYQCQLFENGKKNVNATYFTDDKQDALGTAQAMVEGR